ncbi:decarboxylating 6-phosphogluconate dehydrogenase [Acholeplasma equirhinis]|uniref:phosphogluconate dehydrogenase (NAD(+)-dependent, decarboxylating) n=1 Tax=Acholeplasma equirhinis TaxID=555393 RepID=UPI00197AD01E|nr:decarboxylating 6-phosphogluconate dehydrogenase [Acholeplasma equirhinis]MBN3490050.1 decarboxylating 6-phosphogluconate dehydrogenase [Acholeplasma equirhinis]
MRIHLIGLGKMGANLALNLKDHGHEVIGFDLNDSARAELTKQGIETHDELTTFLTRKKNDRFVVWLLVPDKIVDNVIDQITPYLKEKDIIIDGGNSNYKKSLARFEKLKELDIEFVDVGTSGGTFGARNGACLMIGGTKEAYQYLEQVYKDISVKDGFGYMGGPGAGHFVKMVHNGIEYGMMQAIGEGFELMEKSPFDIDYAKVADVWNNGSIIESALINYTKNAFLKDAKLDEIEGRIDDSGEGKWMIQEALDFGVAIPVIGASLFTRYKSRDEEKFSEKVVAAMRREFGGHAVYKKK